MAGRVSLDELRATLIDAENELEDILCLDEEVLQEVFRFQIPQGEGSLHNLQAVEISDCFLPFS